MCVKVDDSQLVSGGMFGIGFPRNRMPLPEVYPVNAVPYNADAIHAERSKERMRKMNPSGEVRGSPAL